MAYGYTDAGTGPGYLYLTDKDSTQILMYEKNSEAGLELFKMRTSSLKPIMARRSAKGIINVTNAAGAGLIVSIMINGVNQLAAPIVVVSTDETVVAAQIAIGINTFTPGSGLKYTAQAIGAKTNLYAPATSGTIPNNTLIAVTTSGGNTVTTTRFMGGSAQPTDVDPIIPKRIYINADYGGTADPNSLAGAIDITEEILGDRGMVVKDKAITAGALNSIGRLGFFTTINLDTEGGSATDGLAFVDTDGFQEGDLLMIRALQPAHVFTIQAPAISSEPVPVKNIYTTGNQDFISSGFNAIFLQYRYTNTEGGHFIEVFRSIGDPNFDIELLRADVLTLISTQQLKSGTRYLVADVGDGEGLAIGNGGGIVMQAVSKTKLDFQGTFFSRIVNRTLVTALFQTGTSYAIGTKREDFNEVYNKSTSTNPGTHPVSDPTNWDFIPKSDTTYYLTEIHKCSYDITNNIIKKRWDNIGNKLENTTLTANANEIILSCFRWGLNTIHSNNIRYTQTITGRTNRRPNDVTTLLLSTLGSGFANNTLEDNVSFADTTYTTLYKSTGIVGNTVKNSTITFSGAYSGFTNNSFVNGCSIAFHTGSNFQDNEMSQSTISNNAGTKLQWCKGTVNMNNNINSEFLATEFISRSNVIDYGFPLCTVNGNTNCKIDITTFDTSGFSNNTRTQLFLGKFTYSSINDCIASATKLFVLTGLVFNFASIGQCTIPNNFNITNAYLTYSNINRVVFNSVLTLSTYGGQSGGIASLNNLSLNNINVDGENTASMINIITDKGFAEFSASVSTIDAVGFSSDGLDSTNLIGCVDVANPAVFSGTTLTMPAGMRHVGIIFFYNTTGGEVIDTIVNLFPAGQQKSNVFLEKAFRVADGAGLTMQPTAFGSLAANKFASDSLAPVVLSQLQDYFSIKKSNGILHKCNSLVLA